MPRHRRAALAASALLAVMLPPTGADFAFRSFQLPLAILAGIVILLAALLIVKRELRAASAAQPVGEALPLDGGVPREPASLAVAAQPSGEAPRLDGGVPREPASLAAAKAPHDDDPTLDSTEAGPPPGRSEVAGLPSPTGPRTPTT
jgi:hypothetical protein